MENKNMRTILIGIIIAVVAIIAVWGGYAYYKRTPTYTFNLIRESVEKHDYTTFSKHVDTKNLLSKAFDDMMAEEMEREDENNKFKGLAQGLIQLVKPFVVEAMVNEVEDYVKNGTIDTSKDSKSAKMASGDIQEMRDKAAVDDLSFKSVGSTTKDGNFSIVDVNLENKKIGKDFTLKLKMKQLEDGTWQILSITNLREFMKEVEVARAQK